MVIGFASRILVLVKMSLIYRFWDNNTPVVVGMTLTPKKNFKEPRSLTAKSA